MDKKVIRALISVVIILALIKAIFNMIMPLIGFGIFAALVVFCVHKISSKRNEFYLNNGFNENTNLENKNSVIFSNSNIVATQSSGKYDVMFGNGVIDLRNIPVPTEKSVIEISSVFGKSLVKINPNIPAVIKTSCAFGKADLPNGTSINFGEYSYSTSSYKENEPYVIIKADSAFGSIEIVEN